METMDGSTLNNYREIDGDLIELALKGSFDVIAHGVNCFCTQGAGIALQFAKTFKTEDYKLENDKYIGDINKLGTIDFKQVKLAKKKVVFNWVTTSRLNDLPSLFVVNCYTQFGFGVNFNGEEKSPLDYEALTMCMRKINYIFKGKHIGLPKIGCGLAGGIWDYDELSLSQQNKFNRKFGIFQKDIKTIIQEELKDCKVTVVNYNTKK